MQRSVGSIRVTHRGTRFVSPGGGPGSQLLSRGHSRITPRVPHAARIASLRDPVLALRRSARSMGGAHHLAAGGGAHAAIRAGSMRWSAPRRALRGPRPFRAVAHPR